MTKDKITFVDLTHEENNDEFGAHEIALVQSTQFALQSLLAIKLPKTIELSNISFENLGSKIDKEIARVINGLQERHRKNLPHLMALVVRVCWFACFEGAWYVSLMFTLGGFREEDCPAKIATPEGYEADMGLSWTLSSYVGTPEESHVQIKFREDTPVASRPTEVDLLECMAIYCFMQASELQINKETKEAFNWIFEGLVALELANGVVMHKEGGLLEREEARTASSDRGRSAAVIRDEKLGFKGKRDAIQAAWASGKFGNRDLCAEQECAGLGMSFTTARKALRNTPTPTR